MIICLCYDISKSDIKKAIRDGHDSIEKLSEHLQIGGHCGGCLAYAEEILEKQKSRGCFCIAGFNGF
jgi:bacterioferritin-associated ferredoxin